MKYRRLSRVGFLLAFFSLLALCAVTLEAGAGRSGPGAGGVEVEAGVFIVGVIFGDLCARNDSAAVSAGVERPSRQ